MCPENCLECKNYNTCRVPYGYPGCEYEKEIAEGGGKNEVLKLVQK